jgi:hypothetical protein
VSIVSAPSAVNLEACTITNDYLEFEATFCFLALHGKADMGKARGIHSRLGRREVKIEKMAT